MDDATEGKVEEGKQEIFTLRRVPSAKLASSWDKLGSALCISITTVIPLLGKYRD